MKEHIKEAHGINKYFYFIQINTIYLKILWGVYVFDFKLF